MLIGALIVLVMKLIAQMRYFYLTTLTLQALYQQIWHIVVTTATKVITNTVHRLNC